MASVPSPAARRSPAYLSYVGIPRSIRWGYSYGALCALVAGVGLATFSTRWVGLITFVALLLACYGRFVGVRVRIAVWPRAPGDGYDVATRVWGWTSHYVAACVPELDTTEIGFESAPKAFAASQLALCLRLGSADITLPSLHAPAGFYDARDRLEPFRRALRELGEANAPANAMGSVEQEGDGSSKFPEMQGQIDAMRWAKARENPILLRYGVMLPPSPVLRAATRLFAACLSFITLSALLPSDVGVAQRAWVGGVALCLALVNLALSTFTMRLTFHAPAGREGAEVVAEYRVLGFVAYAQRIPLGDGLRLLYVKETSEDSDGSRTAITAYLVTPRGKRYDLIDVEEDDHARRTIMDGFGVALATPRCIDEALTPAPPEAPRVALEEPHTAALEPALGTLSRANAMGVFAAALALLLGVGTFTQELRELRHATAWIETKYYPVDVRRGKHTDLVARPVLDSSVILEPTPPGPGIANQAPCWVIDDPHGHDIARYAPPEGPPTLVDKVRMSSVSSLCLWLLAAILASGPWIRARRSLDVRAG